MVTLTPSYILLSALVLSALPQFLQCLTQIVDLREHKSKNWIGLTLHSRSVIVCAHLINLYSKKRFRIFSIIHACHPESGNMAMALVYLNDIFLLFVFPKSISAISE